ncbi:PREDICTED: alanine--glyoxylate aminotransferase 2, mitochondrial [Habropoda laboriosa]|uniref:alanine--glyoxylate aminotransferase 2, mitochondrial n=1 Tax=Habropoda laboriosa TaxID=597456 RepID=UPI00083D2054|nr:PREDICTED: alanine--glyoxylate aminotransferase 2, mitochondrial [Habropoda laboriosa]
MSVNRCIQITPVYVNVLYSKYLKWFIMQTRNFASSANNPLKMPDCKYVPSIYKGTNYEDMIKGYESIVSPSLKPFYKEPLIIHEGRGQWLWNHRGKRYLDMFGGVATVSVGHSHPKIVAAISNQVSKLNHVSSAYMHSRLYEYVTKLIGKFSGKLGVVYLTNSGSEANELAFLMARLHTRSHSIISLKNGYHGASYGTSASTAMSTWRYPFIAQPPGYLHAVYPDVYKGNWGGSKCRDSLVQVTGRKCDCRENECIASEKYFCEFEETFCFSLACRESIAAFVAESIQGIGGAVQYPKYFLQKVYNYIHEKGGLCIADEVQTGFGRTGEHFWGFESHGVEPDIVTLAKGIGNGFPLGAVVTSTEIAKSLNSALHFNTFGGNPLACVVGSTVLDIIEEESLQQNAQTIGTYLLNQFATFLSEFPNVVGDVRGKGLMIGIELISNIETKKPLKTEHMLEIFEVIKDMGVLVGKGGLHANVLRIKPPLCVTKTDADFTYAVIRRALQKHEEKYRI